MRIGIDFDDVVADSMRAIATLHNKKYGTNFKKDDAFSYKVNEVWGGTKEEWREKLDAFLSTDHLMDLDPMAGSLLGIDALKKQGHELYIVTARGEGDIPATERWIERHFPNVFKDVHYCGLIAGIRITKETTRRTKSQVCNEHGIELMIDDNPDFAKECAAEGVKVMLFDQPWNRGELPPGVERVYSWDEIMRKLEPTET